MHLPTGLPVGNVPTRGGGGRRAEAGPFEGRELPVPLLALLLPLAGPRAFTTPHLQGDYATGVDDEWTIDGACHVADTASFHPVHMNHSRVRPNVRRYYARAQRRVSYFTSRDVQPGEELLYDYGRRYWRGREHLELP